VYFWVGAPAFMRGKERFSAPGNVRLRSCALAPGGRNPGAKAHLKNATLFRWTEVQLPLLKQEASTNKPSPEVSAAREADSN